MESVLAKDLEAEQLQRLADARTAYAAFVAKAARDATAIGAADKKKLGEVMKLLNVTPGDLDRHIHAVIAANRAEVLVAAGREAMAALKAIEPEIAAFRQKERAILEQLRGEFAGLSARHQTARQIHQQALNAEGKAQQIRSDHPLAFGIGPGERSAPTPPKHEAVHAAEQRDAVERSTAASIAARLRDDPAAESYLTEDLRELMRRARDRGWVDLPPQPPVRKPKQPPLKSHVQLVAEQRVLGSENNGDKRPFDVRVAEELKKMDAEQARARSGGAPAATNRLE
jgi:hypothetical protein